MRRVRGDASAHEAGWLSAGLGGAAFNLVPAGRFRLVERVIRAFQDGGDRILGAPEGGNTGADRDFQRVGRAAVQLERIGRNGPANALGRLIVAAVAGPVRYWTPLALASVAAATFGYGAFLLAAYLRLAFAATG